MKKLIALICTLAMVFMLTACSEQEGYTIGVCQLVAHPALDAATRGFVDAVNEGLGEENVRWDIQNASNEVPTCGVIASGFVASEVDLILANATPALQAAVSATEDIPILGTAVTEYGVALDIQDFSGTVGGNVSGTSDLAPLDQQARMLCDLIPDAETVGILYCSSEDNSVYQAQVVKAELEKLGRKVEIFTFTDSNDVSSVTATACAAVQALYIPTDNTAATCAEAIGNVAEPAGIPIINGEASPCAVCGVATLSIDYYELGRTTGEMAVKILKGEADISEMPVEYFPNPQKMYNPELAKIHNIQIPGDYIALNK